MQNVVNDLTRLVVALVALMAADAASAAYDFEEIVYGGEVGIQLHGSNNRGLVAGGAWFADGSEVSFVYDPKRQSFTELPRLPGYLVSAHDISHSGVIVGRCSAGEWGLEGFVLERGTYTRFAYPGFERTVARAIGITGPVTGYAQDDETGAMVGFIYDPVSEMFTDVAFPGMNLALAQGINARGQVVGSFHLQEGYAYEGSPPGFYGFVRDPSGDFTLFRVDGQPTWARGINDAGIIAGFTELAAGSRVGFVGTLPSMGGFQVMTNAELIAVPFAGNTFIGSIDNNGRIVGSFTDDYVAWGAFIATPVPKGQR